MIHLRFPLRDVLILAEHAIAAPDHKPTYSDTLAATEPGPALWCVGDDGLYLISNGLPNQLPNLYADGYHRPLSKHAIASLIGGDDFVDALPLLDPNPDGTNLYTALTNAIVDGYDLFVISMDETAMELSLADSRRTGG